MMVPLCQVQTSRQRSKNLTPAEIDHILKRLHTAVQGYLFPEIAAKLAQQLAVHEKEYRTLSEPSALARRLTDDMRAVALDQHLAVTLWHIFRPTLTREPLSQLPC